MTARRAIILDLLAEGAKITFANEYSIQGNFSTGIIKVFYRDLHLGNRNLDEDGLDYAMSDIDKRIKTSAK